MDRIYRGRSIDISISNLHNLGIFETEQLEVWETEEMNSKNRKAQEFIKKIVERNKSIDDSKEYKNIMNKLNIKVY